MSTLKDVRKKVGEKLRQRTKDNGEGLLSERARAKEALRQEVNTYTGENVRKIAAAGEAGRDSRILRVAAYCRVSTADINQHRRQTTGSRIAN